MESEEEEVESGFQNIDFDNFRCGRCENYLSVTPIYNFDDKTSYNICGRCEFDRSDKHISRNPIYELLAKNIKFPCSESSRCPEKVKFGEKVLKHELQCQYRKYECPICNIWFEFASFILHFQEDHSVLVRKNRLVKVESLFDVPEDRLYFLVNVNNNQYFLRIHIDGRNITVKVDIFSKTSENHMINVFLGNVCQRVQFHHSSFNGINLFHKEDLKPVDLIINILPIEDISENAEENEIKGTVWSSLECPVCDEFMKTKIFMCRMGDSICESCAKELTFCPFCRKVLDGIRNFTLEDLAEGFTKLSAK